jgi:hypothetical protein
MPTESGKPLIVISYAHENEPEHPAEGEGHPRRFPQLE